MVVWGSIRDVAVFLAQKYISSKINSKSVCFLFRLLALDISSDYRLIRMRHIIFRKGGVESIYDNSWPDQ